MKKVFSILLIAVMLFAVTACAKNNAQQSDTQPVNQAANSSPDNKVSNNANDTANSAPNTNRDKSSAIITNEMAEEVALKHAGFKAQDVQYLKSHYEYDDLREIYEVEFYKDSYEYDYDIDAISGEVLSYDKDFDD